MAVVARGLQGQLLANQVLIVVDPLSGAINIDTDLRNTTELRRVLMLCFERLYKGVIEGE